MDRPAGSYIEDPITGEIKPNLNDEAMKARSTEASTKNIIKEEVIEDVED